MTENAHTLTQAAVLTAVASHLTDHPYLCPVNIASDDRLQLRAPASPGRDLVAWGGTFADVRVDVHAIHCEYTDDVRAFVYVVGHLGDIPMSAWDTVPGLVDAVGGPEAFDPSGHMEITLDALRAYAQDGTAPTPAGNLAPA